MYPTLLLSPRGLGTFLAFDLPTPELRDALVHSMRQLGPPMGGDTHSARSLQLESRIPD